jgi:hypothetical protein
MTSPFVPVHASVNFTQTQSWTSSEPRYSNMQSAPAYTAVQARQTFQRPATNVMSSAPIPPPPTTASPSPARQWPDSVRSYVQRAFAEENNILSVARKDMEARLKEIITEAGNNGTLFTIDWYTYPLPQQLIQQERMSSSPMRVTMASNQMSGLHVQDTNILSNGTTPSKKRKSNDYERIVEVNSTNGSPPPWRNKTNNPGLRNGQQHAEKRTRFASPPPRIETVPGLENRRRRFEAMEAQPAPYLNVDDAATFDPTTGPIVGTCEKLEKRYLRLTAPPNPATVRPLRVLEKTLELLKKKWKEDGNYGYACDQFKSLRQDLTVQHIKSEFTVKVYEIHARIALEKEDMGEYNQCQACLRLLYEANLGGHPMEFKAYRILYFLFTRSRSDMADVLAELTPADKSEHAVKHALAARSALALGNYHRFFQLYQETPNMGAYLMDKFVSRERVVALSNMAKAYVVNHLNSSR